MNREFITPADEASWLQLRTSDLTSTDVAALFGMSPYKTTFELWHEKKAGEVVRIAENDRMKWGKRLEATVAAGIADDMGWAIRPMKEYVRVPESRIGSSFDFRILTHLPADGEQRRDLDTDAILEIKTVDVLAFRNGWTIEDDYVEAPAHIELQVQHQMLVSGLRRAYIGVLIGGNRIEVIERSADEEVHRAILGKAREFWQSIADGRAPDPVMPDDAAAVIRMHQYAEPGKLLDAREDAALADRLMRYHQLGSDIKRLQEDRDVLKAELLQRIGDHEKVITAVGNISAGMVGPAEVSYTREPYRNFRFTPSKAAKAAAIQENAA
jgi:putative phage-type endonuclease